EEDLALEALEDLRARRHIRADDLQRDQSAELSILRLVHRPHAALPEDRQDLVACAEERSRRQMRPGDKAVRAGGRGGDPGRGQGALATGGARNATTAETGDRRSVERKSRAAGGALARGLR